MRRKKGPYEPRNLKEDISQGAPYRNVNGEYTEIVTNDDEVKKLKEELEQMRAKYDVLNSEFKALQGLVDVLRAQLKEQEHKVPPPHVEQGLRNEIESLRQQLAVAKPDASWHGKKITMLEAEVHRLRGDHAEVRRQAREEVVGMLPEDIAKDVRAKLKI